MLCQAWVRPVAHVAFFISRCYMSCKGFWYSYAIVLEISACGRKRCYTQRLQEVQSKRLYTSRIHDRGKSVMWVRCDTMSGNTDNCISCNVV